MNDTLVVSDAKHITGEVATHSGHRKGCKIRILVEMEKHKNKHHVHKWYVARGIDEEEVSFKDHDEGMTVAGGTPQKQ